jgi:hypothetical protein
LLGLAARYRWGWDISAIAEAMSVDELKDWLAFAYIEDNPEDAGDPPPF